VENADIRIKGNDVTVFGNDVTVFWEGGNLNRYTYTKSKLVIYD
jgi:hypothetical protein